MSVLKLLRARFRGLHSNRHSREPKELAASLLWQDQHEGPLAPGILPHLLGDGRDPAHLTERDWLVAATLIQWLGSPIGQCFIRDLQDKWAAIDEAERKR